MKFATLGLETLYPIVAALELAIVMQIYLHCSTNL